MTEPIRYESLVPPRDDLERELMDPDSWDWTSTEEGEPAPNAGAILEVRFTREEFFALARLARENGLNPVDFLRQTALDRIVANSRARAS